MSFVPDHPDLMQKMSDRLLNLKHTSEMQPHLALRVTVVLTGRQFAKHKSRQTVLAEVPNRHLKAPADRGRFFNLSISPRFQ